MNGTTCIMYTELLNSSRAFYSEIPPEIIARNLEVDALMRGLNNTCYYSLEALAQMFLSLQAGNFSIGTDVESDIVCEHQGWQEITLSSQITSLEATSELPPSDSLAPPTSDSFSSENSTSFQQTCLENWVCTDWSVCQNNFQARICTESNSCGTQQIKPSESFPCSSSQTQQNQTRTVTLQVFKQGTGTGTVTNLIANRVIDCGSICSASFVEYTAADLSAAPAPGSTFIGWSQQTSWGAPCSGNGTCYMILGVDKNVTAIFDLV